MIKAGVVLVASKIAILTERNKMEPIAVSIEMILSEVAVPGDIVNLAKVSGLLPSGSFDTDKLNVASIGIFVNKKMSKLVQKFERGSRSCIKNLIRGGKFCLVAELNG